MERSLEARVHYQGRLVRLETHRVALPSGQHAVREVVRHPEAVVVVPRLADGRLLLVRQFRFAVGQELVEFPAGTLQAGEEPEGCAARELWEETGAWGPLTFLGSFFSAPGFCDELLHCFLAQVEGMGEPHPEEDEKLQLLIWPPGEMRRAIGEGLVRDGKSLAAWTLFLSAGRGEG